MMKNTFLIIGFIISGILNAQVKVSINVSSNTFSPQNVNINVGDTVEWTNIGGTHNVNGTQTTFPSNPESFGNSVGAGWTYSHVFNIAGSYNYQCDPHASFGMTGTVTVQSPAGVNEKVKSEKIGIFPNPTTKELSFSASHKIKHIEIFSLTGKKVLEAKLLNQKIDVSTLNPGTYFVKMITDNEEVTEKLVIK